MKDIRQVIESSCNISSINFWSAFGFLVEQDMQKYLGKSGLVSSSNYAIFRSCAKGAGAVSSPVQLRVFSSPSVQPDSSNKDGFKLVYVNPAALWFSISADGGVLALMSPFMPEEMAGVITEEGKCPIYIVGVLSRSQDVGKAWVRRCLMKFFRMAVASHPSTTPTAKSQKIILDTIGRSNRLSGKPASPTQAEAYEVSVSAILMAFIALDVAIAQLAKDYPVQSAWGLVAVGAAFVMVGWIAVRRLRFFPY
jgi:hypothetical protein